MSQIIQQVCIGTDKLILLDQFGYEEVAIPLKSFAESSLQRWTGDAIRAGTHFEPNAESFND